MKEKDNNSQDNIIKDIIVKGKIAGNFPNMGEFKLFDSSDSDIYEGHPGFYTQPWEEIIPVKAKCIGQTKSYEFSVFADPDTNKKYLGIKVINYQAGELKISFDFLEDIINKQDV